MRYLFAGNSLTEGTYGESYVDRVAEALDRGWYGLHGEVINAGRSADTVRALLACIDGPLQEHQPDWVVLAIGGNDVWIPWLRSRSVGWWLWGGVRRLVRGQKTTSDLDQFGAAYRALIDRAQQAGARVLACTTSPLGEQFSTPPNRRLAQVNGVIRRVASDLGVPVADVWQAFVEELGVQPKTRRYVSSEWLLVWWDRLRLRMTSPDHLSQRRRLHLTFDGIHLNSRGAYIWAGTILAALARAQGLDPGPLSYDHEHDGDSEMYETGETA
jgi:lysophospholipase L1-like esterase